MQRREAGGGEYGGDRRPCAGVASLPPGTPGHSGLGCRDYLETRIFTLNQTFLFTTALPVYLLTMPKQKRVRSLTSAFPVSSGEDSARCQGDARMKPFRRAELDLPPGPCAFSGALIWARAGVLMLGDLSYHRTGTSFLCQSPTRLTPHWLGLFEVIF